MTTPHYLHTYTPFVGPTPSGSPTPPPSTYPPADTVRTQGFVLQYPASTGATALVTCSRSPDLGDTRRVAGDRIIRESMGGTLLVYADLTWNKVQSLVWTVTSVKRDEARAIQSFLRTYLGKTIGLITHEGRLWSGVVTNPEEAVTQDADKRYTIYLTLEGGEL